MHGNVFEIRVWISREISSGCIICYILLDCTLTDGICIRYGVGLRYGSVQDVPSMKYNPKYIQRRLGRADHISAREMYTSNHEHAASTRTTNDLFVCRVIPIVPGPSARPKDVCLDTVYSHTPYYPHLSIPLDMSIRFSALPYLSPCISKLKNDANSLLQRHHASDARVQAVMPRPDDEFTTVLRNPEMPSTPAASISNLISFSRP